MNSGELGLENFFKKVQFTSDYFQLFFMPLKKIMDIDYVLLAQVSGHDIWESTHWLRCLLYTFNLHQHFYLPGYGNWKTDWEVEYPAKEITGMRCFARRCFLF